jgi:hypothetical protein
LRNSWLRKGLKAADLEYRELFDTLGAVAGGIYFAA